VSTIKVPKSHILSNSLGSFYYYSNKPYTKFGGLFFRINNEIIKCLERIDIQDSGNYINSEDTEINIHVERDKLLENHYLQNNSNSFAYHLSHAKEITLVLDIHKMDDFAEWGRIYSIKYEHGCIIIKYMKVDNDGNQEYKYYVAIKTGTTHFDKIEEFSRADYKYDSMRGSESKRFVFRSVRFFSNIFTMSMSKSKREAIKNAKNLFNNYSIIKNSDKRITHNTKIIHTSKELQNTYSLIHKSMDKLIFNDGIYAGFPWFFQTWARDELICINYLINQKKYLQVKKIFLKYFEHISYCGRLPAIIPEEGNKSADGMGWLGFRFWQFMKQLKKENKFNKIFKKYEIKKITEYFEKQVYNLKKYHLRNGLIYSGKDETWMDTSYNDNGREGFCIEIQALSIKLFEMLYELSGQERYKINAEELKENTVKSFYKNGKLFDLINPDLSENKEIRPNFFIAYYVCPNLLPKIIWTKIFNENIPKLWLSWGGISSIGINSSQFINEYTGENNKSYHRGDSWYFLNAITAICLIKQNKTKYKIYIEKIINACNNECLNNGVYGAVAEVSSAKRLTGYGCLSQAWSNAMFIELLNEYY